MYRVITGEYQIGNRKETERSSCYDTIESIKALIADKKKQVVEAGLKIRISSSTFLKWEEDNRLKYIFMA